MKQPDGTGAGAASAAAPQNSCEGEDFLYFCLLCPPPRSGDFDAKEIWVNMSEC